MLRTALSRVVREEPVQKYGNLGGGVLSNDPHAFIRTRIAEARRGRGDCSSSRHQAAQRHGADVGCKPDFTTAKLDDFQARRPFSSQGLRSAKSVPGREGPRGA